MDCSEVRRRINELIGVELSDEERKDIREHVESCEACREIQDQGLLLKRLVQLKSRRPEPPAGLRGAIRPRFLDENRQMRARQLRVVLGVAASVTIATAAAFFLLVGSPEKLGHIAAAEGVADSFLRQLELVDETSAGRDWDAATG